MLFSRTLREKGIHTSYICTTVSCLPLTRRDKVPPEYSVLLFARMLRKSRCYRHTSCNCPGVYVQSIRQEHASLAVCGHTCGVKQRTVAEKLDSRCPKCEHDPKFPHKICTFRRRQRALNHRNFKQVRA